MPFTKVGKDNYTSPSGRHYNSAQVRLWHAGGGKFPGEKGPGEMTKYAKGGDIRTASYAAGGPVTGRSRSFMKEEVEFRDPDEGATNADKDDMYGKSGPGKGDGEYGGAPATKNKSLSPVKPRK